MTFKFDKINHYGWILFLVSILFYLPFIGSVHLFDWDEINFAESSREMIATGNYFRVMIDYQPFWEKPPLFFWMQVICMKIFGINEFAARLPNVICGVITLQVLYRTGKRYFDSLFGFLWALLYLISLLPFFYFKSGIIDPFFNLFIFLSLLYLIRSFQSDNKKEKLKWACIAGTFNGLAVLTKGPVGLLLIVLTVLVFVIITRNKKMVGFFQLLLFGIFCFIISSVWYLPEMMINGTWFLQEFVQYQIELLTQPVAGHQQGFYYHFLVVFFGCFPISIIAFPGFLNKIHPKGSNEFLMNRWMIILALVVLILFTVVSTKIVHYSSMTYLPLSFIAANWLYHRIKSQQSLPRWMKVFLMCMGLLYGIMFTITPYIFSHIDNYLYLLKDPFARASFSQQVNWNGFEWMFGVLLVIVVFVQWIYFRKNQILQGFIIYGLVTLSVLTGFLFQVIPKIERCTQGGIIDFYKEKSYEDSYLLPISYKTYAHYFYMAKPPGFYPKNGVERQEWLTRGDIDKPVYFVVKLTEQYVKTTPGFYLYDTRGGFEIYRRDPVKTQ